MAKNPYIQFYLGDYIKDTRVLPLNVKGGWVDLILAMWNNEPKGELIGTIEDYARIMNCSVDEANLVIHTLKQKNIFNYHNFDDGIFQIISRKQKKMVKLSETRKSTGKEGGNPKLLNQNDHKLLKQNTEYEYKNEIEVVTNEIDWEGIKNKWNNDFRWKEKICRDKNIDMPFLEIQMKEFISERDLKEDYKGIPGLKSHFINWFNKRNNGSATHQSATKNGSKAGVGDTRTNAYKNWGFK